MARTPDLDTIAEMQIETNSSSAKFTRPTTIVMSSRSGTNQVHGALFYTNRNSGYGVARQRQDTFTKPPYLNRNEFGGSVGGPVFIPKVYNGHNRTFFFFSWEDIRSLQYQTRQAIGADGSHAQRRFPEYHGQPGAPVQLLRSVHHECQRLVSATVDVQRYSEHD